MNYEVLALIIYFTAMLTIGMVFFLRSKNKTDKDYFLGGRKMGPWVTAMSAQASDMSAWLLMGLPGSILAFGLGQAWIGIGLALGTALNWILIAKRLRRFSQAANDSITLPQYLSNRFATKSKALQVVSAVVFLVCFTLYVASAFVAGANVFTSIFSVEKSTAMLIFAVILIVYTFLGGYKAVCWTDFFQGTLMIIAVLAVPIIIVLTKDLDTSVLEAAVTANDGTVYSFVGDLFAAPPAEIASGLAWGLGYFGMPHILVRFMSIEKPSMVKKSSIVATVWVVLALVAVIFIAVFGRILIGAELLAENNQSMVFVELSRMLFPTFIAGLLLSAIIAASMSTADSQLLVASSSFTSDIYKPIIRKKASDRETLWVGRGVVLIVSVIAYFIASSKSEGAQAIMNLVENAWAGFGSAFGPVVILSLFWRRFTYKGALAGVIAGALTDVLWLAFLSGSTGIYELIPGFAVGMLASVVVTLIDKKPSEEVIAIFDEATKAED
ncbi:MAG: sodium/proline symporter PutP [Clostridia bacterium]|nr:sodium/proline symporter PutP [Clostridia bacterium]